MYWNYREDRMLLDLRAKGFSFYRIAHEFGMTKESIRARWHKIKPKKSKFRLYREFDYRI
jgi:hypothetical protein